VIQAVYAEWVSGVGHAEIVIHNAEGTLADR
jgi:hypothetical protein